MQGDLTELQVCLTHSIWEIQPLFTCSKWNMYLKLTFLAGKKWFRKSLLHKIIFPFTEAFPVLCHFGLQISAIFYFEQVNEGWISKILCVKIYLLQIIKQWGQNLIESCSTFAVFGPIWSSGKYWNCLQHLKNILLFKGFFFPYFHGQNKYKIRISVQCIETLTF